MKLGGVLNHRLAMVIAEMGHTDGLTIADAGLPVPLAVERIDLAVSAGVPSFTQVLQAVASELKVEEVVIAKEALENGRGVYDVVLEKGLLSREQLDQILNPKSMV